MLSPNSLTLYRFQWGCILKDTRTRGIILQESCRNGIKGQFLYNSKQIELVIVGSECESGMNYK
jgi:hypothetical protein